MAAFSNLRCVLLAFCLLAVATAPAKPSPLVAIPRADENEPVETANTAEVGTSLGFIKASEIFLSSINPNVDPCEDFFEFACGQWIANNKIPDDEAEFNIFTKMDAKVLKEMKELYESADVSTSRAINDIRQVYRGCMDVNRLNTLRGIKLVEAIKNLGYWPIVHGDLWVPDTFDLTELLIKMSISRGVDAFVELYVSPDKKNVSRRLLHIDQGSLDLGASTRDFYLNTTRYQKQMAAYENFMIEKVLLIAEDAGFPKKADEVAGDVKDIINFEKEIAEIMIPEDERRNYTKMYNIRKMSDLDELMPVVDWDRYFRAVMPFEMHSYIDSDPDIVVAEVEYLKHLTDLLKGTDNRTLANYMIWRYTSTWSNQLDERYDNVQQDFLRILTGKQVKSPRWRDCSAAATERMMHAAGALYVRAHFNKEDKETAAEMIEDLHAALTDLVKNSDWMENETRDIAVEKSEAMGSLVGYPDFIYDDKELDDYYSLLKLTPEDNYAEMVEKTSRWAQEHAYKKLVQPVDRKEFFVSSSTTNAFYSSSENIITLPAGILQSPMFDRNFPKAVNYGGIGSIIGHEITHGFDDQGGQFDKKGNLVNWWDNKTRELYMARTKCIVDQYSSYEVPGTGLHINGRLTQGENFADIGSIKEAYYAYRRYIQNLGHEEKRLPGLEKYSNDQIFYMAYGQTWCGTTRPETAIREILTAPHSPLRFRTNGVVVNQPEFARAFGCPVGSPMNPEKRCLVW